MVVEMLGKRDRRTTRIILLNPNVSRKRNFHELREVRANLETKLPTKVTKNAPSPRPIAINLPGLLLELLRQLDSWQPATLTPLPEDPG